MGILSGVFNSIQKSLYVLMDSAYDAPEIREFSAKLNHVVIIDYNKAKGDLLPKTGILSV